MDAPSAAIGAPPGLLDRFLRLFSEVRAGEGAGAVLLALNVFLILTAYYILKPAREALILAQGSAELKSYLSAGQVVLLAVLVPLYGRFAARLPRRRLINWVTSFFVLCLAGFFFLARTGLPIGVPFYLWIGIFNLMIVAQFWSFANDVYTEEEGERLFPIVAFGASAGAVLGALVAGQLIEPLGIDLLLLAGAGILVMALLITNYVDHRERDRDRRRPPAVQELAARRAGRADTMETEHTAELSKKAAAETLKQEPATSGAFGLVFRSRYLLFIGLILLLLNWVNTTGEYILASVVEDAAAEALVGGVGVVGGLTEEQYIGEFYASFQSIVNLAGLFIQLFLVSRVIKYVGGFAIVVLPVVATVAYGILAFFPVLAAIRWAKTAENSLDYSLNNTARNMLFLPTSRAAKYAGKQAIDAFFVRVGDVLSAAAVFVGTTFLALGASGFAKFNLGLVLIWLVLAIAVAREYRRRVRGGEAEPGRAELQAGQATHALGAK